ncbi:MAG: hypothetical protein O6704_03240 [Nitrospinae bacterium]|nr:hypothetical protein [Nitrospinota bacterium]
MLVGIGLNYQKLGELERTAEFFENALDAARYLENRKEEAHILVDLGDAYTRLENPQHVSLHLSRAEKILSGREEPWAVSLKSRLAAVRDSIHRK